MQCHKCIYNNKQSDKCLTCKCSDDHHFEYQSYIPECYDTPQYDTSCSDQCTTLSEDDEDKLRKALYEMFRLKPLELLLLQAVMTGKTLTEFAHDIEHLSAKNQKCSRHHAFQLRKSLHSKLPQFGYALLTTGQRKQLKDLTTC